MTPDQAFALNYFHEQQQKKEQFRQMNQKILDRQTFERSAQRGEIARDANGNIIVQNVAAALNTFGHQPQMLTPKLSQALHSQDPGKLGEALTEIWQGIRQ